MTSQPSVDIVIAHYNEDVSWLADHMDECIIYSKGGEKNAPAFPYHAIPNIGREGHTYLHHIIEHYDSLADITIFLQGRVDDHISMSPSEIRAHALKTQPGQVTTFPFRELETFDHWDGIPWEEYPSWVKWSSMERVNAARTPAEYWQIFFPGRAIPASVGFQPGALFAVHKDTIQQHSLDFYRLMMKEFFLGDMAHINPETGHHMERFWLAIWAPSEYVCWDNVKDVAREKRNKQGQLAKGRWHITPKWLEIDEGTLRPEPTQLQTPPSSDDGSS
ncbi:hypothetical protein MMC24_006027 [Lignoscripta atroalba]|nr:hypothetical protein [Lignoscripta atroalba]